MIVNHFFPKGRPTPPTPPEPQACSFDVMPSAVTVGESAETIYFNVVTDSPYWSGSTSQAWLVYSAVTELDKNTYSVEINVSANSGDARQATINFGYSASTTGGTSTASVSLSQEAHSVEPTPEPSTPDYMWYKTTTGAKLVPHSGKMTGITSNVYTNGKGTITFSNTRTTIDDHAFSGKTAVSSVTFSSNVGVIGAYAFNHCSGLTEINLGKQVTDIRMGAFNNTAWYKNKTKIITTYSVLYIGNVAYKFYEKKPSTEDYPFVGERITLKDGCTAISEGFLNDTMCLQLTIPKSVKLISYHAFYNYKYLISPFEYKGTKAQWRAITKGTDWAKGCSATRVHCTDGYVDI